MTCKQRIGPGLLAVAVTFGLISTLPGDEPARKKLPIPDKAAQLQADKLVAELYGADYTKARKDPVALAGLARTLLQEARDTADYPAARYVLFQKARQYAAQAGDVQTALQAVEEAAQEFVVPPEEAFRTKVAALTAASKTTAQPESYQAVVDAALLLLDEALGSDDYDDAQALLGTAETSARKLKVVALVRTIQKRAKEVDKLQTAYAKIKPAADKLRENPLDPEANLIVGRYQALTKGNWEKGLPLLARGSDATLKALAKKDLTGPEKAPEQLALANGWWQAAVGSSGDAKTQLLVRAFSWYQQAAAHLEGKERAQVDARMKTIMDALPPEYRVGSIVAEVRRFDGGNGPVYDAALAPDGHKVVAGGADAIVRLWDTRTGKELRRLEGHRGPVWTVAYSPDGRQVLSGSFDRTIRLWDIISGRQLRDFPGHDDYVRSVCFSRDGRKALSGGDDRLVRLWDIGTGKEIRQFKGHNHFVWSVALSRDARQALSGSLDKTVRLWDVQTGSELQKLTGHTDTVMSVAFSPDNRRALSGSTDGTIRLWDLETGKEIRTLRGQQGYVLRVAFAPDGRRALSAGADGTLRLWDLDTGEQLRRLEGGSGPTWAVAFARDGRWAVSAGNDGLVRLWGSAR